ncbi:MAG TPA: hypothetical protein VL443_20395 [Cyclobacteriaceae bacterium]|jgi:hypothetical protein|nr:hypothetical protein [Cyclobacteriaceae bacterium]
MLTRENLITDVQTEVANQLIKNGFVIDVKNEWQKYVKEYSWGYDYCFLPSVRFRPEHITFSLTIHRRINLIETVWQEWSNLLNVNIADPNEITTFYITEKNAFPDIIKEPYYDGFGAFLFEISQSGLAKMSEVLDYVFNKKMIPKLLKYTDLNELNNYINNEFQFNEQIHSFLNNNGLIYRRMAIAKYANDSSYEKLCDFFKSTFEWYIENGKIEGQEYLANYPVVFDYVYKKLMNVKPLEDTQLS